MHKGDPRLEPGLSSRAEAANSQRRHDYSTAGQDGLQSHLPAGVKGSQTDEGTDTPTLAEPIASTYTPIISEPGHERYDEEALRRRTAIPEEHPRLSTEAGPQIERLSSHPEPWAALESAESRVTPSIPRIKIPTLSEFATTLYTVSYLVFFSIFGALARIGLSSLTVYPGAPVLTGVLWANVGGSLLMGFFGEDRKLFREEWGPRQHKKSDENGNDEVLSPAESMIRHKAIKKTIPLYIGLTTGFCGSFTSFSTVIRDTYLALANDLPDPSNPEGPIVHRNGGFSFMAVLAIVIYTPTLCHAALMSGAHLAAGLDKYTPTLPFTLTRRFLDPAFVVLGLGCWLGSIFLALWPPDRDLGIHEFWRGRAVFAVVFAPLGTLLRYYVSIALNPLVPKFPLGTFTVNILGTMILGMCWDLQHAHNVVGFNRRVGCQVLAGLMDGFCGCLTTVSTWVAELSDLDVRHAYPYLFASLATALATLVVIIGPMEWTVGLDKPVC